jgi:hypothetical protein
VNGRFLILAGRIRQELLELDRVVQRTHRIWAEATHRQDDYHLDAVALNLHGYYAGLERLLELIADTVDQSKPNSANWHQELLRQLATEIPQLRPAVLSEFSRNGLDEYRGFRHVVRNVYSYNLDPARVELLVKNLEPLAASVKLDLLAFADFLQQLVNGT